MMSSEDSLMYLCGGAPVGEVESLLYTIAVVHIDVDVQHARVHLEQLQNAEHKVVHVAEAARLCVDHCKVIKS